MDSGTDTTLTAPLPPPPPPPRAPSASLSCHRYPAALNDVAAAYLHLVEDCGVPPDRVVVCGESAGGGLAMALVLWLLEHKGTAMLPAQVFMLSPWLDLACSSGSWDRHFWTDLVPKPSAAPLSAGAAYVGVGSVTDPLISPFHATDADLAKLAHAKACTFAIQVGRREGVLDEAVLFAQRLQASGCDVQLEAFPDMVHVFQTLPVPDAADALRKFGALVRRRLAAPGLRANTASAL